MKKQLSILLLVLLGTVSQIMAQQNAIGPVSSVIEVYVITTDNSGNEVATKTEQVTPGDVVEYRVIYTNNQNEGITNLQPVLPIPLGMEFIMNSPSPQVEGASISNTGQDFQRLPLTRTVRKPDGATVTEEIPVREYRRLRWMVPSLGARESVTLRARVKVIDN
ncbi:MAG: hypothetical protein AAFW89_00955 [Bacteroidota bacterium]